MKTLEKIGSYLNRINESLAVFSAVLIGLMAVFVTLDVTKRFLVGTGLAWVLEMCEYAMLVVTFAAAAWVLQTEGHVSIDFAVGRLKPRDQHLSTFITSLVGAAACLALAWMSAESTWVSFVDKVVFYKVLNIPRAPIMLIIPVGGLLLFIQFLRRAWRHLEMWKNNTD